MSQALHWALKFQKWARRGFPLAGGLHDKQALLKSRWEQLGARTVLTGRLALQEARSRKIRLPGCQARDRIKAES